MTKTYVLYHANCPDGFGAAWSFFQKYKDEAEYIPVVHGKKLPIMDKKSELFIVDFSYSKDILEELNKVHKNITVLDHHKTAKADLEGLEFAHFDMNKSGAVISYEFLFKDRKVPTLLKYLEDRDLWLFKLKNSKEAHAFVSSFNYDFTEWNNLAEIFENRFEEVARTGATLLKRDELEVKEICAYTRLINFENHQIPCVNTSVLNSDVGNYLLKLHPKSQFSMSFYINKDGLIKASLRSRGDFDVSTIAKKYNGGGHPSASGCIIDEIPK